MKVQILSPRPIGLDHEVMYGEPIAWFSLRTHCIMGTLYRISQGNLATHRLVR